MSFTSKAWKYYIDATHRNDHGTVIAKYWKVVADLLNAEAGL